MQDQLKIAFIQTDLIWEDAEKNRDQLEDKIESITESVDLIILPEMFTTGFTMNASSVAETMEGKTVEWMRLIASENNAAITGSIIILEDDMFFNRLLFVYPDGKITYYDKRHTFTLVGEDDVFQAGKEKVIIDYLGWKICPMICYDLRFPVWARNVDDYDVLLYVANWPKPRIVAWDALLQARAIENMCYTIGVNRIGLDDQQNEYCGHSTVYDVLGSNITPIRPNKDYIEIVTLEQKHITYYRNKLKFLDDKDTFTIV